MARGLGSSRTQAAPGAFSAFVATIAALRHPEYGCPWDLEQTHLSLRRYMLEEAYEAFAAMSGDNDAELCEELGDVLLQVVLNAQLAQDRGAFAIKDVIASIDAKMRRRHPHVFGAKGGGHPSPTSKDQVRSNWEQIKAQEKAKRPKNDGLFAEVESIHPATRQALAIGKLASKIGFDWSSPLQVLAQVRSELDELEAELKHQVPSTPRVAEELSDVYFSMAQLARHLKLDVETVSLDGNNKFLRRFREMEALAAASRQDISRLDQAALEELWRQAKSHETKI